MIGLRRTFAAALLFSFAATAATVASAQDHQGRPPANRHEQPQEGGSGHAPPNGPGVLSLLPADAVTEHTIDVGGASLAYTATAGTFSLFDQTGERSAAVFYTAYVAKSAAAASRPVTFVFNGGPGAASAFLNLGLAGPRLLTFGKNYDGTSVHLVDNPQSWLAFTDLVLIDPVGTGWSRAAKPDDSGAFWGVRADAESMAKVIALYVAKNSRLASPKFILGESYGGFRAAKVARALQSQQGILVNGIIMVSPMLEGAFQFGGDRFALGAALQLPSLAAAELEHKGTFSADALARAEHFALTDYLTTLAGPPPQGDAAKAFYGRVAAMTGLPEDVLARAGGFIHDAYVKDLNLPDHKIASQYDATFAVDDPNPEYPQGHGPDPILDGIARSFGSAFVAYARDELGFKTEMTYNLLNVAIAGRWKWDESGHGQPSVTEDLRVLLALTPTFRLMIAHGYSDMVTPYAVTRYVLDHIPSSVDADRAELRLYRGGHMLYLDPQSRAAFTADARAMYSRAMYSRP